MARRKVRPRPPRRRLAEILGPAAARRFKLFRRRHVLRLVGAKTWAEVEAIRQAARPEWGRLRADLIRHDVAVGIREELDAILLGDAKAAMRRLGLEPAPERRRPSRSLKRLPETPFNATPEARRARYAENAEAWARLEAEWQRWGVLRHVHAVLEDAGRARARHETALRERTEPPATPELSDHQHRLRRVLAPLEREVTRMKNEFPRLGATLAGSIGDIRRNALLDPPQPRVAVPHGRPRELWLEQYVLTLVGHFRSVGVPWRLALKWVYDALVLDAHGDIVSYEWMKRFIRRARQKDPAFGEPRASRMPRESEKIRPPRGP